MTTSTSFRILESSGHFLGVDNNVTGLVLDGLGVLLARGVSCNYGD